MTGAAGSRRTRRVDVEHVVERASDRYGVVILLLLATYVLASALPDEAWAQVMLAVISAVTVMATLAASGTSKPRRRIALLLATIAVFISLFSALVGGHITGVAGLITGALLTASLVAIVRRIATHDHVSAQTLLGAMCCYVLFGLVYTFFFEAIARLQTTPFLNPPGSHSLSDYLFFSFTTLTTTGYGDLVPATGLGRALAMLEALMGQLFLVTVLARLVALWVPARRARDRQSAAPSPGLGED